MEPTMERNMEPKMENQQRLKMKDLLLIGLIIMLGAAHVIVMLQSVGIIRADR